ncbi:A/G-specific adenine glycosylase [Brevibacterium daeguense]|uniref:Adenine DNA glycosylase n=1 Tax=Brevibacterium daeguense TaxID=909936 RepID=A0ABP8EL61_9MICO
MQRAVVDWFAESARDLPWRRPGTSAWGVLVSEVMSQQTPMSRVAPRWEEWLHRWPTPADLAAASPAEVLLAWDSLGYPRRALRLREAAAAIAADHDNVVPVGEEVLRSLPGIGPYTAAAVTSFAHGTRTTVLDVNIRRVLHRIFAGRSHPAPAPSTRERAWASAFVPQRSHVEWNAGTMELGALVCTSRRPACEECPVAEHCRWLAAGKPIDPQRKPTTQAWNGTDRQLRGAVMAVLRSCGPAGVRTDLLTASARELDAEALAALPDPVQQAIARVRELGSSERVARLIADLIDDGLAERAAGNRLRLPG